MMFLFEFSLNSEQILLLQEYSMLKYYIWWYSQTNDKKTTLRHFSGIKNPDFCALRNVKRLGDSQVFCYYREISSGRLRSVNEIQPATLLSMSWTSSCDSPSSSARTQILSIK